MCRLTNLAALALYLTTLVSSQPNARDDGRFANSPLKPWFDRLASGKGLCCSFADGFSVQDVDWDTQDGHYRVRIYGQWFVVPDAAVVTEANRTHKFAVSCLGPARSTKRTCQSLSAMSAFGGKAELVVSSSIGGIPAPFEHQSDTLDHKVVDFASTRLAERFLSGRRFPIIRINQPTMFPHPFCY